MISALSPCHGIVNLKGHAEPLTPLCYFASCFKTDSSAQALVIVQRFKPQQNNSLLCLAGEEKEASRTTILKQQRPSKQNTT